MEAKIYQKEFNLIEIFKYSIYSFKTSFNTIFKIFLYILLPLNLLIEYFIPAEIVEIEGLSFYSINSTEALVVSQLVYVLIAIMIAILVKSRSNNENTSLGDLFNKSLPKYLSGFWVIIILSVFLLGLYMLLIIPGIIFSVLWIFSFYAVVLSNKTGISALKYSRAIVSKKWWKVFIYTTIILIVNTSILFSFSSLQNILKDLVYFNDILLSQVITLLNDFVTLFFLIVQTVFFLNLENANNNKQEAVSRKQ